ncbi:hypothetical protein CLOLEP_00335 [[Clostridium] leptum DSM 753]|uniref:Uncharacterized protein n=2 Tax=root TaxID=1 RepID=A7VP59_9FIRM|nr:hypothetical protein CLOLEP_03430 [[Clostridium] leptum DSM 753]EDO62939.1 hypothetical protein CLOLEP_00335 [[Clostridium] leptum DSM 753]DAE81591.1 MAG TPA: hypothetical protein [Caudoviricetes sp.]DAF90068.1 MAG TPA: hypothetical protein [Siphoviridae sp. ctEJj1]
MIIFLEVLICRYSPYLQAFPAFFVSEETHIYFYIRLGFCFQK